MRACVCPSLTSLVATSSRVSMTDRMGLTLKSVDTSLGGRSSRPLGSWSLGGEEEEENETQTACHLTVTECVYQDMCLCVCGLDGCACAWV